MLRNFFVIFISAAAILFAGACQSVERTNVNVGGNKTAATTNAPPEFSGNTTNGTAADPNAPKPVALPKGATPTPGIPSEAELKKQMTAQPKNTPPIPGIPSEAELKKQMSQPISNERIREMKPPTVAANSKTESPNERPSKNRKP